MPKIHCFYLNNNNCNKRGHQEPLSPVIRHRHEVEDGHEDDRGQKEQGQVGQLPSHKVNVYPVEAVEMLAFHDRNFPGENL